MENNLLKTYRKDYDLFDAALATVLFILFNAIFLFCYRMLPLSFRTYGGVGYYVASFLIEFLFGVTAYVVARSRKVDFVKATGLNKKINGNIVFYCILISFASLFLFGNLTNVFIEFLYYCGYSSILGGIDIPNFGIYLVYVLVSCVTPAVCEEILFRGVVASGFKEKGFKVALIASSLIFMLMHGGPEQTVHQFIIGLVVGYMFLKTGNIWLGIIVHFFNNFISVTQAYLLTMYQNSNPTEVVVETTSTTTLSSLFVSLMIAIAFALVGYFIVKRLMAIVCYESDRINAPAVENSTIKVDDAEVDVQMTIDGQAVEKQDEQTVQVEVTKDNKIPTAVIVMFAVAGAYFAFEWLSALFMGLGIG